MPQMLVAPRWPGYKNAHVKHAAACVRHSGAGGVDVCCECTGSETHTFRRTAIGAIRIGAQLADADELHVLIRHRPTCTRRRRRRRIMCIEAAVCTTCVLIHRARITLSLIRSETHTQTGITTWHTCWKMHCMHLTPIAQFYSMSFAFFVCVIIYVWLSSLGDRNETRERIMNGNSVAFFHNCEYSMKKKRWCIK